MKKTFTKLTLTALIVCGFGTAFTATAFGDTLTFEERLQYAEWNSSYDTFRVAPSDDPDPLAPHGLFNIAAAQYTDRQSVATYNNSADFYAERGVKSLVSDWTVSEGSQIVGMSRSTGFAHSLNLTGSTGTVWNTSAGQELPVETRDNWIDSLDGSQNIDVGALGAVNMSLTAWWVGDNYLSKTIYGDQPELYDGIIRMLAYDVSDLVKAMGYAEIENAFMFTWEDGSDFDYNDLVFIMTNVSPNIISATPEPATMLIIGLGLAGLELARRRRRKK
ncbi:hypothetical protein FACS189443_6340 [Planctomycetales bacterium]|nr:hypothetical protein FACS189443_6340 [Planctomycetales bacterium]